ncbi:MAG: Na+/H+ antiporter NhaA, partial [Acidimicrobiia bacterium]
MAQPPQEQIHETWLHSDRPVPSRFIRPVVAFTRIEAAGGIVLLIAAVVALVWANSPWYESYFRLFNAHIEAGGWIFHIDESFKHLINDGLMAIFFFVVGLEIKRELAVGELNSVKKATLPALAALGGMVVPALIYVGFV